MWILHQRQKKVPSKLLRKCLFSLWSRGIRNTSLFATWVNHPAQDDHISGQDSEKEQQPTILRIYTAAAYTIFWWLKTASAERMMQDLTKTVCLLFSVKNSRLNCLVMTSVFTEPSTCTSRLRLHARGTVFFLLFFFFKGIFRLQCEKLICHFDDWGSESHIPGAYVLLSPSTNQGCKMGTQSRFMMQPACISNNHHHHHQIP